jgi:hypothetical protein
MVYGNVASIDDFLQISTYFMARYVFASAVIKHKDE